VSMSNTRISAAAAWVLLDIEGTIGSKLFLKDVLAPYAARKLPGFIADHQDQPEVASALTETRTLAGLPEGDAVAILLQWIAEDRKAPPLKKLQGLVWRHGFESGEFQGHLFADAVQTILQWSDHAIPLAIYSSGSVAAQKLYFSHSVAGNITARLQAHFDTDVGAKTDAVSYQRIAQALQQSPDRVLFLSDSAQELHAARSAGMQVIQVVREDTVADAALPHIRDLSELKFTYRT
jgi:enolase-phosphatase E1